MNQPSAQTAIDTLQSLHEIVGPASMAYFIAPNAIIAFSGARGVCDGVFYSPSKTTRDTWRQEITSAIGALKTLIDVHGFDVEERKNPSGNHYVTYGLTLRKGLEYSLEATQLLAAPPDRVLQQAADSTLFQAVKSNVKQAPGIEPYSDSDCGYIATGILLGYPDKAIIESIGQWWHQGDQFSPRMIEADIRGAGYYGCPQPVYSYPRSLATDPDINQHEALWSGILKDFYESEFHQNLAQQTEFQDKIRALGR